MSENDSFCPFLANIVSTNLKNHLLKSFCAGGGVKIWLNIHIYPLSFPQRQSLKFEGCFTSYISLSFCLVKKMGLFILRPFPHFIVLTFPFHLFENEVFLYLLEVRPYVRTRHLAFDR